MPALTTAEGAPRNLGIDIVGAVQPVRQPERVRRMPAPGGNPEEPARATTFVTRKAPPDQSRTLLLAEWHPPEPTISIKVGTDSFHFNGARLAGLSVPTEPQQIPPTDVLGDFALDPSPSRNLVVARYYQPSEVVSLDLPSNDLPVGNVDRHLLAPHSLIHPTIVRESEQLKEKKPPATIAEAISNAIDHMRENGMFEHGMPVASVFHRRIALLNVFEPPNNEGQKIKADSHLSKEPVIANSRDLYGMYRKAGGQPYFSFAPGRKGIIPFFVDVGRIDAKLQADLAGGMNPDRAYSTALLSLITESWATRDARDAHERDQEKRYGEWTDNAISAEKEHADALAANEPRGFDGRLIENHTKEPGVVYEYAPYEHHDDPVG